MTPSTNQVENPTSQPTRLNTNPDKARIQELEALHNDTFDTLCTVLSMTNDLLDILSYYMAAYHVALQMLQDLETNRD